MPTNQIYKPNRNNSKVREVGASVAGGTPLIIDGIPCVTDAASTDSTRTETHPGFSVTYPTVGVGYPENSALVHRDGTFEFAVTGATTSTDNDVKVYLLQNGNLSLTQGGGDYFGKTDYPTDYVKVDGRAPVQIGAAE